MEDNFFYDHLLSALKWGTQSSDISLGTQVEHGRMAMHLYNTS